VPSTNYFVRVKNKEFNYSNNQMVKMAWLKELLSIKI
jgi:hypothetical protein